MSTTRNRKVCTQCRQAKSRCDANVTFPMPCSRCSRLPDKPLCRLDSTFKRVPKLKGSQSKDSANSPSSSTGSAVPEGTGVCGVDPSEQWAINPVAEDLFIPAPVLPSWTSDFTLGSVSLSPTLGEFFLESYNTYVHSLCPILLYRRIASTAYAQTPFLFWSMVWVVTQNPSAMENIPEPVTFKDDLALEMKELVARLSIEPSRSVDYVQGLLLLCEWPFPSTRMRESRIWHYSNLAAQICLQNGYHRPYHSKDFSSRAHVQSSPLDLNGQEQTLAWAYTQVVCHNCACALGMPSFVREDWVTRQVAIIPSDKADLCTSSVPPSIRQSLRLSNFDNEVALELGQSTSSSSGQVEVYSEALIRRFLRQANEMEQGMGSPADSLVSVRLLASRIRVCTFGLQGGATEGAQDLSPKLRLDYYAACIQLIQIFTSLGAEVVGCWPMSIISGACASAIGLCKVLSLAENGELDEGFALRKLEEFHGVTARLVRREKDEVDRFTRLLGFTLQDYRPGSFSHRIPFEISSRIGLANWLYEAVARAKTVRGFHDAEYPSQSSREPLTSD